MRRKREKGFRKIKIIESNIENSENIYDSCDYSKIKICIIIIIIISSVVSLYFILNYLLYNEDNENNINNKEKNKKEIKDDLNEYLSQMNKTIKNIIKLNDLSSGDIKLSIIIMNNNNKGINIEEREKNFEKLYESIKSQVLNKIEIIIVNNQDLNFIKNNNNLLEKIKNDKYVTIIEYEKNISKILIRYDAVNMVKGDYFLFVEENNFFSSNELLNYLYDKILEDKLDILEFKAFHHSIENKILYQPKIFSEMFFDKDNFNNRKQFHINGKIFNKNFFLSAFHYYNINRLYFSENIQKFDQSMILLILLKKAKNFESINIKEINLECDYCEKHLVINENEREMDLLLFMKFFGEYTGDNVPEKRMAIEIFMNYLKQQKLDKNEELIFLRNIIDFFLNCDKIGEHEIKRLENYKSDIDKMLKPK